MVVFQGSIPVPVQDDEVVIDHVTAPEDAPMSSLLASREVSPGGGKLPKAAGIFPPLDLGLALQSEKPVAQSGAPDQEQATSPLGLRKRRCVKGLGLLDLPRNAREEDRGFYVGGIGNQASSPEAAHNGSSQLQASGPEELWKQFKRAPTTSTSTMFLLLILAAFAVVVAACAVSILFVVTLHTKLEILSDEVRVLRSGISQSITCLTSDDAVGGAVPKERYRSRRLALYGILFLFVAPFLFFKYGEHLPKLTGAASRESEENLPFSKRLAYRVDVLFSHHSVAKPLALLLATIFLIAAGGVALFAVGAESLADTLWVAWTYVADAGNHADSVGFGPRLVSVCISFGGMLIFALMVGLVSDAISEKVDSLRKGKSQVVESNHTLILGWSDKLGSVLRQLAIANQSLGGGVVVILAERDKEAMEADIAKLEFDFMGTFVICRSGSPLILADLKKVSVSKARSIIILAEVENADQSDARALRVVLNVTGVREGLRGHVVVELSDVDNEQLVKLVGGDLVETLVAHDVIGRLMIQCARQPGLALIWEDILGFQNAEFYFKRWPQLDGTRFEDVLVSFPDAVPVGVKVASAGGKIVLNPEDEYVLSVGDELLVLAEDDDTYSPGPAPEVQRRPLPTNVCAAKLPERILFCGWRRDIDDLILVVDEFVARGSELWLFSEVPLAERDSKLQNGGLTDGQLVNTTLIHREGNAVIRRHLESLPLEIFDSILILADEALEDTPVYADSRSVATLLLIRDIQAKRLTEKDREKDQLGAVGQQTSWIHKMEQASHKSIVISEILDSRTKNLVSVSVIGDYVLSNELVSMALAMVAEEKQINRVLEELFAKEGNEMYIRKAGIYLYDQEKLSFYEIMIRARQRKEVVIGYRRASQQRAIINPPDKNIPVPWSVSDVFIVLAREE